MSDFYKSMKGYSLGSNRTLIVVDQLDYARDNDINKVVVRSKVGYPNDLTHHNTNVIDGYSYITEVSSQDPLTVITTDLTTDVTGYDGLVVSGDGYKQYRGVIESYTTNEQILVGGTFVSYGDQCWLIGGYFSAEARYNLDIWYSENGQSFQSVGVMPDYFTGRVYASGIIDESLNIYIIGGYQSDEATVRTDIIRGNIVTLDEPTVQWEGAAWFDGLSEYTKAAYDVVNNYIFISEGFIDIDDVSSGIQVSLGTFAPEAHTKYTYFLMEEHYNVLVFSNTNFRYKWEFDYTRATIENETADRGDVFTHRQSAASTTWTINHNIGNSQYTFVCFGSSNEPLEHASRVATNSQLVLTFAVAESGSCFILKNAQACHGDQWLIDGYSGYYDLWQTTDTEGHRILGSWAAREIPGGGMSISFDQAEDGYFWCRKANYDSAHYGLGYLDKFYYEYQSSFIIEEAFHNEDSLWTFYGDGSVAFVPASISRSSTSGNISVAFSTANGDTGDFKDFYTRGLDGYLDNEENWGRGFEETSWGQNQANRTQVIFLNDHYTGYTANYTNFTRQNKSGNPLDGSSNLYVSLPVSTGLTQGIVSRSIDSGASWTASNRLSSQSIAWYGRLGSDDIDTSYKVFFYPRAADTVWESSYGYTPTYLIDDNHHHYHLLAPTIISSYANGVITIATYSDQPSVVRDEWLGYWLHLVDATDDEEYRYKLTGNSTGGAGANIELYVDADDLDVTPTTSDYIQVVVPRDDAVYYYRVINREIPYDHTIWYDGYASPIDNEKSMIPYTANKHIVLPENLNNENNVELFDWAEKQPMGFTQFAHTAFDIDRLTTKELVAMAEDQGIITAGLDERVIRNALYRWREDVDAYGGCLDGINNIIKIIMGPDTDVEASMVAASNSIGKILQIDLGVGSYSWTYTTAANTVKYGDEEQLYYMPVLTTDVGFDAREIKHMSFIHIKPRYISDPIPIFKHSYDFNNNKILVWSDDRLVEQYEDSVSSIVVMRKPEAEKLYATILNIKKHIPDWVTIQFV